MGRPTLSSRRQHTHSSYPSTDRRDVQQWTTHMPIPTVAIRNLHHWRNFHRLMPTCNCICYELIFRCYCGRPRTNVIHLKKLETLPTLVGTSKAPPSQRPPVAPQALLDVVSCSCTAQCCSPICCSPFISKQLDIEDDEGEPSVDNE